jgi:hypothetical protein
LVLPPWLREDSERLVAAFQDPAIQFWHTRTVSSGAEAAINDFAEDWRQSVAGSRPGVGGGFKTNVMCGSVRPASTLQLTLSRRVT